MRNARPARHRWSLGLLAYERPLYKLLEVDRKRIGPAYMRCPTPKLMRAAEIVVLRLAANAPRLLWEAHSSHCSEPGLHLLRLVVRLCANVGTGMSLNTREELTARRCERWPACLAHHENH